MTLNLIVGKTEAEIQELIHCNMSAFTTYYATGGMASNGRTKELDIIEKTKLCELYPEYCKIYKTNYDTTNIKLKSVKIDLKK